ncbi:MAG: RNA polymerase sigma factor [Planctomycetota bacterium JB042]
MTVQDIDDRLIAAAASGDHDALSVLLARTEPFVRSSIRAHCSRARRHVHSLDDLTQRVLVDLHRSVPRNLRGHDVSRYLSFVAVVTRRRVSDAVALPRLRSGGAAATDSDALEALTIDETGPTTSVEREEAAVRALIALSELDEGPRSLLEMAFFQHLSTAEIARALSIRREAAHNRLVRAIRLLQRRLRRIPTDRPRSEYGRNQDDAPSGRSH